MARPPVTPITGPDIGLSAILTMAGYVAMLARKFATKPVLSRPRAGWMTVKTGTGRRQRPQEVKRGGYFQ